MNANQAAKQIGTELGQSNPKGDARLAAALEKPMDSEAFDWNREGIVEQTAHGTRRYISPQLLRTVKIGETWSLDYAGARTGCRAEDCIVEFDGYCWEGCLRWKHASGRVFIYVPEQCCRLIYTLDRSTATAGGAK